MTAKRKNRSATTPHQWVGYPVCVVLNDGSYYTGTIAGIENNEVIFYGNKGKGKIKAARRKKGKAKTSGFLEKMMGGMGLGDMSGILKQMPNLMGGGFPGLGGGGGTGLGGGGLFGGGAAPAAGAGAGGFGNWGSLFRFGFGALRFIMPLMGMFKI